MKRRTVNWAVLLILGVILAASGVLAQTAQEQAKASSQTKTTASSAASSSDYAGPDACKTCHEDLYNNWEKAPHWKTTLDTQGGPSKHGCEACHGAAASHVADPSDTSKLFLFEKASAKDINERCLTCHAGGAEHMNAVNSIHRQSDVSCTSCHSPHHPATREHLLVKAQPELCYTCHLTQKAQFNMPFHHRVNEGLVQCTDCHNPHGTVRPNQVRTSAQQDAVCFKCHADKQGPFVFEHEAVKIEGCTACHIPHGSPNQHMMKFSTVNVLCLQCHTNSLVSAAPSAPSFHNQNAQFQACTLCHTQIHGSNFDRFFFK